MANIRNSIRILILEANPTMHNSLKKDLQKILTIDVIGLTGPNDISNPMLCFEIDTASQGKSGVDKVKQANAAGRPYAIIFSNGNDVQTIKLIWEINPDTQVIICSVDFDFTDKFIITVLNIQDNLTVIRNLLDEVAVR